MDMAFDFVYSLGVLHHLPDPEKGFRTLLPLLRAGKVMAKGLASSVTEVSPEASRARIARLVGSARAAKTALSWSVGICNLPFG